MWTELVEIFEKRCRDTRQPHQVQARAAVLLYGGLTNCQEAFLNYKGSPSPYHLANATFAMDAFISVLQNVDSILSLLEPDMADKLRHYALEENRLAYASQPKELLKFQVELLRDTFNMEARTMNLLNDDPSAFTGAKAMLAEFIHQNFSIDELLERDVVRS
ncbi:hypothetical protein [Methylohalobius crimeensis]|uniref:hypothetical protein n=1 Tax=Methylohalobius crimeensis TaxID=244365 RepID=UPI0003B4CB6C|nr:hypothetical protein [Methylohalobius crimeensis]